MNEATIGANIRAIRLASQASLTEVARRAGVTKSTLSKIETGQTSSPISTLIAIADALGARLSDFVREAPAPRPTVFTPKGQGRLIVRDGSRHGYAYEALAVDFPNRFMEPFVLTITPEDREGTFRHGGQEFIYLLEGRVEFTVGEERFEMEAGDALYFDPDQVHKTRLLGDQPARLLSCFIEKRP